MIGMAATLGVLCGGLARAMAGQGTPGLPSSHPTHDQRRTIAALSERIVPTTDTPGAIAAGVPEFIGDMLTRWYDAADARRFLDNIDAVAAHARARHGGELDMLAPMLQDQVLTALMEGRITNATQDAFEHLKQVVLLGYYTSEIGVTQERMFVPVPGESDGAYPYARAGRIIVTNLHFN